MNASGKILRDLLERGEYLERFTVKQTWAILPILERANDELTGKIAATRGPWTREWLAATKADIDAVYQRATAEIRGALDEALKPLADEELATLAESFHADIPDIVSVTTPSPSQLWATIEALPAAAGSTLGELTQALGVSASRAVTQAIQVGMVEGETVEQMVRRVRGRVVRRASWRTGPDGKKRYVPGVYEGGVMSANTRQAEVLVRTAVMHVANQAREELYKANEDIIKGFQYVATLDNDTCVECGALDGTVYGEDDTRPSLPLHVQCRCILNPVLKSFRELGIDMDEVPAGTRASMDGQVPANETFNDRLERMSAAQQNAILGPSRGQLYRGGMPLADMVRPGGGLIPLAELGKRSGEGVA